MTKFSQAALRLFCVALIKMSQQTTGVWSEILRTTTNKLRKMAS